MARETKRKLEWLEVVSNRRKPTASTPFPMYAPATRYVAPATRYVAPTLVRPNLSYAPPIPSCSPRVVPDTRLITINVNSQYGYECSFMIKRCTPLNKLMTTYYERKNMEYGSLRFLLDGTRVRPNQTPQELGIDDGDEIDAMMEMEGGTPTLA